ncbi:probable chitinase 10 [Cylas formicarius]|uniref:probable chitinase 10 n=1 Tax=Cylas formicarius TaxID=197179 RepID=UPI0029589A82|nr:probable chitinase 10 [Cylas formicarius]
MEKYASLWLFIVHLICSSAPALPAGFSRNLPHMFLEEYGSKSLPLRTAVESRPDRNDLSHRVPLRDAVERRPPPGNEYLQNFLHVSHKFPSNFIYQDSAKPLNNPAQHLNLGVKKDSSPKVVCFVTNWAFYRKEGGKFVPENVDPRLCTHVIYAFASLDPETLTIKEFDRWADFDNKLYERITALKNTKVLLSLGGWSDSVGDKYSRLVRDEAARQKFTTSVAVFLRKYNFKGLHFDWNYPICWQSNCKKGPASDKPNFNKLMQELRREFDTTGLELAASISGYKEVIDVAYDLATLSNILDFISVMTYDYHGFWEGKTGNIAPLYYSSSDSYPQYNVNYTMEYLVSKGAIREKLLMGIPFYGQSYTLPKSATYSPGSRSVGPGEPGDYTKQPGMLAYYEICYNIKRSRWNERKNGMEPYAYYNDQWVGYENIDSVRAKVKYVKDRKFGGVVAWTIDLDDFSNRCCNGPFPLLRSINRELNRIIDSSTVEDCAKPPPPSTPAPPEVTTGIDSGASEHDHHTGTSVATSAETIMTWWPTSSTENWWSRPSSSSVKPSTSPWWTTSSTTAWWTTTTKVTTSKPSTTSRRPPTAAPTLPNHEPPIKKKCHPGQYLPDDNNCNAFYRCVGGELQKQVCGGGLHWNRNKNTCDWPSAAKCKENYIQPTTSASESSEYSLSISPYSEHQCNSGSYYSHEDCGQFYICVNNHLVPQNCPPGLYWNVDKANCDWQFNTNCTRRKDWEQLELLVDNRYQPYSACDENAFASFPGDCSKYMHCLWGKFEVYQCAPGLYWSDKNKICDWPIKSECQETENDLYPEPSDDDPKPGTNLPTTTSPRSTTEWQYQPPSTSEPGENPWEWHPPIPPTSEKPPLPEPLKPFSDYFKIVCYFTNWAWYRQGIGRYLPEDIDENLCTHIVYGFAVLDFSNLIIKPHDSWADFDNQFYKRVVAYKSKGVKVSIAIGGWNDSQGDKYSRLVNDASARKRFIDHVLKFLDKHGFDGLDLDWEYPKCWQVDCSKGPDSDKASFSHFVRELKEAFMPKGYLLSAAVSPSKTVVDQGYDVPVLGQYLDWVAVMTYDFHGQWDKKTGHVAPLYYHPDDEVDFFNSNYSINYWISEGVPRRKIVMGMPLYGQSFRLEDEKKNGLNANAPGPGEAGEFTRAAGFLAYYEICNNVKNSGWTVVKDPENRMGPYAYKGSQWVSYDDKETIKIKSNYIRKMDLGGGMIWALDLDDFKNRCGEGRHPLLTIIRNTLADPVSKDELIGITDDQSINRPQQDIENEELNVYNSATTEHASTTYGYIQETQPIVDRSSKFKVVCYFTNWAWYRQGRGKYLPSDIDVDLCTHIVYGFAVLDGDRLLIKPHDTWADFDNKFYEKVTALRAKGIKVLIAIGGWNDSAGDKYSRLVNDPSDRSRFITNVVQFIEDNNFDGLDLDWEYPKCWQVDCTKGPESDKAAFAAFIKELHNAFSPKGWLLSAAVSPSRRVIDGGYDVPVLSQYLDWIAVMTYDYHGQWDKITGHVAPMYTHPEDIDATFNANFTIHYWIEKGADRKKLVMGIPMYGQSFSLADNQNNGLNAPTYGGGEAGEDTRARGFLAYYEICTNVIQKKWNVVRDRKGRMGPYAYLRDQWVSFDDIGMVRHKSQYVKAMELGGAMIWALDLDDFKNECNCEEYPLLRTINRVLRNYSKPAPKCVLGGQYSPESSTSSSLAPTSTTSPVQSTSLSSSTSPSLSTSSNIPSTTIKPEQSTYMTLSCNGRLFLSDNTTCNKYYVCDQGQYLPQYCPGPLLWNVDHCDWPENTICNLQKSNLFASNGNDLSEVKPKNSALSWSVSSYDHNKYKIICYFRNRASRRQNREEFSLADIDPSMCTHINYGFISLDPTSLKITTDLLVDVNGVADLKAEGVKVLLTVGDSVDPADDRYFKLVINPGARATFVSNIAEYIEKWQFDGLDLNWPLPKNVQVDERSLRVYKEGFSKLIKALHEEFKFRKLLLSAAISHSETSSVAEYDTSTLNTYLDWILVMPFGFYGNRDSQRNNISSLVYANFLTNYWIEKGVDNRKLVMGIPFYGRYFTITEDLYKKRTGLKHVDTVQADGLQLLPFYEICQKVQQDKWRIKRDPSGTTGPLAYSNDQWILYDDVSEVKSKARLIKQRGLGGGVVWALDLDDFENKCACGKSPLLRTLKSELQGNADRNTIENCI